MSTTSKHSEMGFFPSSGQLSGPVVHDGVEAGPTLIRLPEPTAHASTAPTKRYGFGEWAATANHLDEPDRLEIPLQVYVGTQNGRAKIGIMGTRACTKVDVILAALVEPSGKGRRGEPKYAAIEELFRDFSTPVYPDGALLDLGEHARLARRAVVLICSCGVRTMKRWFTL